mmetsp:Transcript_36756/g.44335  ORF Transcript_36756/g.44335 Transcript_36756/m.44335 type:complete len:592 (+) Transcript_36756:73-1848(+)
METASDNVGLSVDPSILGNHIRSQDKKESKRLVRGKAKVILAFTLGVLTILCIAIPLFVMKGDKFERPLYIVELEDVEVANLLAKESGKSVVFNPETAQYKAMLWVIYSDPMKLKVDSENLLQRYGLATMYYATRGEDWDESENWLNGVNECYWYGVKCFGHDQLATNYFYGDSFLDPVTEINLESNNLVSLSLPIEMILLRKLRVLNLSQNKLYTEFPPWIGKMADLRELKLNNNLIHGTLPTAIREIKYLEKLDVSNNVLTGRIRSEIGSLISLRELNVANNPLSSTIPEELYALSKLEVLDFHDTGMRGSISSSLQQLSDLEILDLGENYLEGSIYYGALAPLTKLEAIFLDSNILTGVLPKLFGVELKKISLHNNRFTGSIPDSILFEHKITHLDLSYNSLTGTIPSDLSEANNPRLTHFLIQGNSFIGTLPDGLYSSNMEVLHAANNLLTGTISLAISEMIELTALRIDDNEFTGTVPWTSIIGSIQKLEILGLHNNKYLTGTIPSDIGLLTELRDLALGGNQFDGTIPKSVGLLKNLRHFWVEDLKLTGSVPTSVCDLWEKDLKSFMSDCVELKCTCCTSCGGLS